MTQSSQAEVFARTFQSQVARNPGAACLTLPLLRALGVREAANELCASKHVVSHGQIVELLVMNRLQAPRPLYKVQEWLTQGALSSALGVEASQAHDTRLGETLDAIYEQHQAIWQRVVLAAVREYHLPLDWLHYDITSTYFEGEYSESELIKFGYSRDQRPDSKQLNLGLTTQGQGVPLAFRVLVGNTADSTTTRENMEAVRKLLAGTPASQLTVVHDRGMATSETLLWYAEEKQRFISPVTADSDLQAVIDAVPESELLSEPLEYHPQRARDRSTPGYHAVWRDYTLTVNDRSAELRLLVVHSAGKARLDAEKRQTLLTRLTKRLTEIQGQLNRRKYKHYTYAFEQIHLAQRGNGAQNLVDVSLQGEDGELVLTFAVNAAKLALAEQRDGRYPILTNRADLSAADVFGHFKEEDRIEKRFWVLKGPLRVHPMWLHKDERLVGLVLVLMIALLIYSLLEYLARQAQRSITGRALLEAFATYTVVLLRFSDESELWTFPELSARQADLLAVLHLPTPQATLCLA